MCVCVGGGGGGGRGGEGGEGGGKEAGYRDGRISAYNQVLLNRYCLKYLINDTDLLFMVC